jgi:hypothetical protein
VCASPKKIIFQSYKRDFFHIMSLNSLECRQVGNSVSTERKLYEYIMGITFYCGLFYVVQNTAPNIRMTREQRKGNEIFFIVTICGGETESTWHSGHYWPIVPAPDDR